MQKKKPSFQVIPNCRINGAPNWNESKEVPVEQGLQGHGPRNFSDRYRLNLYGYCRQNERGDIAIQAELPQSSRQNGATQKRLTQGLRQPCSLNIQAKYETLGTGRLDSLSRASMKG